MNSERTSKSSEDVAVIGAGIVGLAVAWRAARSGARVTVFERRPRTEEATVRNFGMIWPIGQPFGPAYELARRSRDLWLELAKEASFWIVPCGSVHLAHRDDEWRVIEEFRGLASRNGVECELLSPERTLERMPAANPEGLRGGLWSPTELAVNPRKVPAQVAAYLTERFDVRFRWETPVVAIEDLVVRTSSGESRPFDRIVVASGADMAILFPEVLAKAGLRRCKLQMMKTMPQPEGWKLGPHLASGLTLRHYRSFAECPGLEALKRRVAEETPELDRYGIHVMISQNDAGEAILGDSHEYDDEIAPFGKALIDELILRELRKIAILPDWTVTERWDGIYVKHPSEPYVHARPAPQVDLLTGLGGAGMTLSLGVAERLWTERI